MFFIELGKLYYRLLNFFYLVFSSLYMDQKCFTSLESGYQSPFSLVMFFREMSFFLELMDWGFLRKFKMLEVSLSGFSWYCSMVSRPDLLRLSGE